MGEIVFWTIMRTAIVIPAMWILRSYIDFELWWTISLMAVYLIIVHPTSIHYKLFEQKNKDIIESTLCSSCKHFDRSAVLCMKHDKHPSMDFLPCEGVDWEPGHSKVDSNVWES
jgi:hypothetical protein